MLFCRAIYGVGICSTIVVILFTTVASYAQQLRITEFLYDAEGSDVGKEYVEIINLGPGVVQATDIVFIEHGKRHKVQMGRGKEELDPGEVAVIVHNVDEFREAYPAYRGIIFDSAFSLQNTESTLELLIGDVVVHDIAYQEGDGGSGTGESLHVSDRDRLSSGATSIGTVSSKIRELVQERTGSTQVRSTNSSTQDKSSSKKEESTPETVSESSARVTPGTITFEEEQLIFTIEPDVLFTSSSSTISLKKQNETPLYGVWNFGDGRFKYGDEVTHTYTHPGEYIITFELEDVYDDHSEDLFFQKTIQVINPEMHIERIDDAFIRFVNTHSFTVDVSGWVILSDEKIFTFPKNSFIRANTSINIPFITKEENNIFFMTSGGGQFLGYQGRKDERESVLENKEEVGDEIGVAEQAKVFDSVVSSMSVTPKGTRGVAKETVESVKEEKEDKTIQGEGDEVEQEKSEVIGDELRETEEEDSETQEQSVEISEDTVGMIHEVTQEERQTIGKEKLQNILKWLTLLIGLIALAAAPFFLEKRSKKKNMKKRIQDKKNN